MRVLITAGLAESLVNFRGPLLSAMHKRGIEVIGCAAEDNATVISKLGGWGVRYVPVPLKRAGLNPLADCVYRDALVRLIEQERPDAILAYTHKPVVFSALAAARSKTKPRVYALITGLGFAFIDGGGLKQRLAAAAVRFLYRHASRHFSGVIFQNPDDQALFQKLKLVRPETPQIIVGGSGIDLEQFAFATLGELRKAETLKTETLRSEVPETPLDDASANSLTVDSRQSTVVHSSPVPVPRSPSTVPRLQSTVHRFLLIARLLGDKGIREYVDAARIIKARHPATEFHLIGPTDPNPAAIKLSEVEGWHREGVIVYHGSQSDVRPFLRDCTVYVLPSYREGTPRTVLEAMATGRPVITTDAPGCRETLFDPGMPDADQVRTGRNGFLVPVKSVDALGSAMRRFIENPSLAAEMGAEGRRLAVEYYDVHKVNQQILEFMGL